MRALLVGLVGALLLASPGLTQDVVGTSVVNGKTIEILSNSTWRYKEKQATDCSVVKYTLSFCGAGPNWKFTTPQGDAAAMYQHDAGDYGEFIIEHIGSRRGVTMDFMHNTVLANAASFAGQKTADVPALSDQPISVDGFKGDTVVYKAAPNGMQAIFYNTIVVTPDDTVQIVTFSIGPAATAEGRRLHQSFVDQTHLK